MNTTSLLLGALRVAPSVLLLPLSGLGVFSWPLRVAVALALSTGVLLSPESSWVELGWFHGVREVLVGTVLALLLALPWMAIEHGAALVASQGPAIEPVARFARWVAVVTFVAAGGHHGALRVLAASWRVVPAGATMGRDAGWLRAVLDATSEAFTGSLLMASSGLLALVVAELVIALAARVAGPVSREGTESIRALSTLAAVALGARATAELALVLGRRAHALAATIG